MFAIEKHEVKGDAEKVAMKMINAQGKYKHIGSGSYGSVYGCKKSNVVYKIGDASDNEGYIAFIRVLSKQKKQNPFMPVIYGVRFIKDKDGDEYFVVAMEKLESLPRRMYDVTDWFEEQLTGHGGSSMRDAELAVGVKRVVPKELSTALAILQTAYDKSRSYGADWDLHEGNFMMRGKQVVCTDPLA
jgi:hypothetical protein